MLQVEIRKLKKKSDEASMLIRASKVNSHRRMILNRSFFGEKYKQYLTFSVKISANTLITLYSKHSWSDEQQKKQFSAIQSL